MSDKIDEYFQALARLQQGKPLRVTSGTKINNDTVSLEAGRKKGTIKKSRPIFHDLIAAIREAEETKSRPVDAQKEKLVAVKAEVIRYRTLWEEALKREVCLVKQLWEERREWASEKAALTGEKVTPILNARLKAPVDDDC